MGHYTRLGDALTDPVDLSVLQQSYLPIYGPDVPQVPPVQTLTPWLLPLALVGSYWLLRGGKGVLRKIRAFGKPKPEPRTITVPATVVDG